MRGARTRRLAALLCLLLGVALAAPWSSTALRAQTGPTPAPGAPLRASLLPFAPRPGAGGPAALLQAAPQGTQRVFNPVADAELRERSPGANFGIDQALSAGYLKEAGDPRPFVHRALLHFDLGAALPPGTIIHQARLHLALVGLCDYTPASRVTVYRVGEPWSETGVTWADQPAFAESYGLADVPALPLNEPLPVSFDVTALAQAWVAGQQPEYGLMLRGPEAAPRPDIDCAIRNFLSKGGDVDYQPGLLVDYTLPAAALLSPAGHQGFSRATCADIPAPRVVTIGSNHPKLADWSVTVGEGGGWLTATAGNGRVSRIFPDRLTLAVAPGAPCRGSHQATVTVQAPGLAAASFTVTLVNAPPPPRAFLPMVAQAVGAGAPAGGPNPMSLLQALPPAPSAEGPARVALLMGVADYASLGPPPITSPFRAGEWGYDLRAPDVDVHAIASELGSRGGFTELVALVGPDATVENYEFFHTTYVDGYDSADLQLLEYYSVHMAQTTDLDGPADEGDGLDEVIAPFEASQDDTGFSGVILDDRLRELLGAMQTTRAALIVDACHSAGIDLARPEHAVLAASAEGQLSWESSALEHGLFTRFMLQAMQNPALDLNGDGWLSLYELYLAVRGPVAQYARDNIKDDQGRPVEQDVQLTYDPDNDFPVVRLPGAGPAPVEVGP